MEKTTHVSVSPLSHNIKTNESHVLSRLAHFCKGQKKTRENGRQQVMKKCEHRGSAKWQLCTYRKGRAVCGGVGVWGCSMNAGRTAGVSCCSPLRLCSFSECFDWQVRNANPPALCSLPHLPSSSGGHPINLVNIQETLHSPSSSLRSYRLATDLRRGEMHCAFRRATTEEQSCIMYWGGLKG